MDNIDLEAFMKAQARRRASIAKRKKAKLARKRRNKIVKKERRKNRQ